MDFENKYVLRNLDAPKLLHLLINKCELDNEYPKGLVSSIYFDTHDLYYLREKANSDFYKTKYRMRWYRDYETEEFVGSPFIEIKAKTGEVRNKLRLSKDYHIQDILKLDYSDQVYSEIANELRVSHRLANKELFPHFIVNYRRVRFKEPVTGRRYCLDFDIHPSKVNPRLTPYFNCQNISQAVFEIKGPEPELPNYMKFLENLGAKKDAFSKYIMCYRKLKSITD
jgi:hypothetical protein